MLPAAPACTMALSPSPLLPCALTSCSCPFLPTSCAASLVSQPDMDSMAGGTGWDMQDVLLRLGAQPGEYLTHIIMVSGPGAQGGAKGLPKSSAGILSEQGAK